MIAKDETKKARLATVLYNLLETIRITATLLSAFMPTTMPKALEQIGACEKCATYENADKFGVLPLDVTVKKGEALFPRIDVEKEIEERNDNRNWAIREIPLIIPNVDLAYQREVRNSEVAKIVNKFDINKVEVKSASIRKVNGKWRIFLMDGAHTLSVLLFMKAMGYPVDSMVVKLFVGLTQAQEADLFATQNEGHTNIRGYERYKADLCAQHKNALNIDRVLKEFGLTTKVNYNTSINRNRNVNAIEELYRIEKTGGEDALRFVFSVIQRLGWGSQEMAYTQRILAGLRSVYKPIQDNPEKESLLVHGMKALGSCKQFLDEAQGTDKYEGHPAEKVRAYLNGLIK